METVVHLTKDGLLLGPSGSESSPLAALCRPLRLEEGYSLRSFFSLLVRYPVLLQISQFLPAALEDAGKCPAVGCRTDEVSVLVLGKTVELIGFPGKPRSEIYIWLRGLVPASGAGDSGSGSMDVSGKDFRSSFPPSGLREADRDIRFISLRLLLDTPLVLGGLQHVLLGDVDQRLFCETRFTLFEIIDGLAWELGFQGGTQQCSIGR